MQDYRTLAAIGVGLVALGCVAAGLKIGSNTFLGQMLFLHDHPMMYKITVAGIFVVFYWILINVSKSVSNLWVRRIKVFITLAMLIDLVSYFLVR
ncbi:hypothetical protein CVV65_05495 [Kyrpidia spormannii]|uniref:Uncharacterized protein n=1 Tax=Kyrpidia spormannii TaxID=2055160 RepID=A0A2K8N573_9BACL|nr:hypothetical protein [Kyrpidia spormannii]ATY84476.1 hypothetical protein CVV65_05495 [Kyrpidia spormannii]